MAGPAKRRLTVDDCEFGLPHWDNNSHGVMDKTREPTSSWQPECWDRYGMGLREGFGLGLDDGGPGWGCFYDDRYYKGKWWW